MGPITEQAAFRIRNDDGSQSGATWFAALNTNATLTVDTNWRVRFLLKNTGDGESARVWQLQYNLNAAGWISVDGSSSVVRSSASTHETNAAALTQQLGSGTYDTSASDEFEEVDGRTDAVEALAAGQETEVEFCFQIRSADVTDGDSVQLRVTVYSGSVLALSSYTATPTITVSEGGGADPEGLLIGGKLVGRGLLGGVLI